MNKSIAGALKFAIDTYTLYMLFSVRPVWPITNLHSIQHSGVHSPEPPERETSSVLLNKCHVPTLQKKKTTTMNFIYSQIRIINVFISYSYTNQLLNVQTFIKIHVFKKKSKRHNWNENEKKTSVYFNNTLEDRRFFFWWTKNGSNNKKKAVCAVKEFVLFCGPLCVFANFADLTIEAEKCLHTICINYEFVKSCIYLFDFFYHILFFLLQNWKCLL